MPKAVGNRTILSGSGRHALRDPARVRILDARLISSLGYVPPLRVNDIEIVLRYAHLGGGCARKGAVANEHRHEEYQVEYVLSGAFRFTGPQDTVRLQPGHGILIAPELPHSWECVEEGTMLGAMVGLQGPSAKALDAHLRQSADGRLIQVGSTLQSVRLDQVFDILLRPEPYPWRREMIASLLHVWAAQVLNDSFDLTPWKQKITYLRQAAGDRCRALCERAVEFIHANCAQRLTLDDIATQAGVTPRHLSRLFRRYTGESVKAVLLRVRLERARDLLTAGGATVKEVAYACGFSTPSHFTQCFRHRFGRLPRELG
ncbi:MAG: hypothetical protein A3K19_08430 [Lentisphaerae bacterium RIFOXYB12_FULL_65_16]|nr:MAG: hypothetical protein A3K18_00550 [Lentisphaerae bacterium RIFOXYA12_64_32]OGV90322.1 MAG: hypothetical protein A3K19_08430 [Lentisphaerae bacterium RIFOXYB12_FULL_65_16]